MLVLLLAAFFAMTRYNVPLPLASTLKLAAVPGQRLWSAGPVALTGTSTVRLAQLVTRLQVPLTTTQ